MPCAVSDEFLRHPKPHILLTDSAYLEHLHVMCLIKTNQEQEQCSGYMDVSKRRHRP